MSVAFHSLTHAPGDTCFSATAVNLFQNAENLQYKHVGTYVDIEGISGIWMETAYSKFDLCSVMHMM